MARGIKDIEKRERPNVFGTALRDANIAGTIPSDEMMAIASPLKSLLFRIYLIVPFLSLMGVFLSQLAAMYRYRGDRVILLENIGNTGGVVLGVWCSGYPLFFRKKFLSAVENIHNKSVICSSLVDKHPRLREIRERMIHRCGLICIGVRISITLAVAFWVISPFIIRFLQGEDEQCPEGYNNRTMTAKELLREDGYDQFCFIMWLPVDAKKYYGYILGYQVFCYTMAFKCLVTISPVLIYLYMITAAEFEIVGTLVELVDEMEEDPDDSTRTVPGMQLLEQSGGKNGIRIKNATVYLKEVIKVHQSVLCSAEEINLIQGRCAPGPLAAMVAMIIASLFQITVVPSLAPKLVLVLVAVFMQIFIYTFIGENIYHQSEKIGTMAYGCRWYDRSTEFKRLIFVIIGKAQSPCCWDIMNMLDVRIAAFADITAVCYRIFMVLLQFESEAPKEDLCMLN